MSSDNAPTTFVIGETEFSYLQAIKDAGVFEDSKGFATRRLTESMSKPIGDASTYLRKMEEAGLITREKSSTRTYSIALTSEGHNVLDQFSSMGASHISNTALVSEIYDRLNAVEQEADHSACEAEIAELNTRLQTIANLMEQVESGTTSWLDTFPQVMNLVRH